MLDSRFLGVAYNFKKPDCRYVFLLWHVRTARRPAALVVPARQSARHDVPYWARTDSLTPQILATLLYRLSHFLYAIGGVAHAADRCEPPTPKP